MKKLLTGLAAAGLVATTMTGCGSKADITIAVWGEYLGLDAAAEDGNSEANFIAKVKEETGLVVNVVAMESNEGLEAQLLTNKIDIVFPSEYQAHKMMDADLLAKLDYSKLSNVDTDGFHQVIKDNYNTYHNGALTDYAIPYSMGDLRIATDKDISAHNTNGYVDIKGLIDSNLSIGFHDDVRNIALIAELYAENTNAATANNPEVNTAEANMKALFNYANADKFVITDDVTLAETSYAEGEVDVIIGYNADPLWMFWDNDTREAATVNYFPAGANNLWVDTLAMTHDANTTDAHTVIDLIYGMYADLDVVWNGYTPIIDEVYNDELDYWTEEGTEYAKAFALSDQSDYYAMYDYKKGTNADYIADLTKALEAAR